MIGSGVINVGSEKITSDLAYGLQTSIDIAEEVKKNHCNLSNDIHNQPQSFEVYDPETQTNYVFDSGRIKQFATERVEEIFLLLLKNLYEKFGKTKFPGGLVLVGGGASLQGIHEIAKNITGLPVYKNIYNEKELKFILDFNSDPTFANSIAILSYAINHPEEIGQNRNIFDTPQSRTRSSNYPRKNTNQKKGFLSFLGFGG